MPPNQRNTGPANGAAGPRSVFISYSHRQQEWVRGTLQPCLEAGGANVLIDHDRFAAGKQVVGQMDALQGQAGVHLLVLSREYLGSDFCRHEMKRAVECDPEFEQGAVIPVRRDDAPLPEEITRKEPLHVDLRNDRDAGAWDLLMGGCGADLGCTVPAWLQARDEVLQHLRRKQSVNLVVDRGVRWAELIEHIGRSAIPNLKWIDLESGAAASRRGLLTAILRQLGVNRSLPNKPEDLVEFTELLKTLPPAHLALSHFHYAAHRQEEYGIDLFATLRDLMMRQKKLCLLIHSRQPFISLLPANHPLSEIDAKTCELRGRP